MRITLAFPDHTAHQDFFAGCYGPGTPWDWVAQYVADEHGCSRDAVGCVETDDGDMVTVGDAIVAGISY